MNKATEPRLPAPAFGRLLQLLGAAALLLAANVQADGIAVKNGRWYTMQGPDMQEGLTALIEDGQIIALGANLDIPFDYNVVDANGKVVTPGLIESHSQLGLQEIDMELTSVDSTVTGYPSGPGFDPSYAINPVSVLFAINRVEGITRAVVAPRTGNDPLAGWLSVVRLAGDDVVLRRRMGMFGRWSLLTTGFTGGSRAALIQRTYRGFNAARRFSPSRYRAEPGDYPRDDVAALKELLSNDLPLVLEVHRANEIRAAIELARTFRLPLVILGGTEAWQLADELAAADVAVVLDVLDNLPISFEHRGSRLDNAALLHAAGVRIAITSEETQNAGWMRQGAGNAVANGLPWVAAFAAITSNPAAIWDMQDGAGYLREGGVADLVIWSGDPLEVTSWAERVMIDGKWVSQKTRQTRLLERYRQSGAAPAAYR